MPRFNPANPAVTLWSVEPDATQIVWADLPAGVITAWCSHASASVDHGGGPGSIVLDGLVPNAEHRIEVTWAGGCTQLVARTLSPPPGEILFRFATLNDLHIGAHRWGALKTMVDRSGLADPHPLRCARAGLAEAEAWGAQLIALKGDTVHHQVDAHFAALGALVDQFDHLPMMMIPGNHDVDQHELTELPATIGRRALPYITTAARHDAPGIGIVLANTAIPGRGPGALQHADQVYDLVGESQGPAYVGLHHQLQPFRFPTHYPPGIDGRQARPFLAKLAAINPNVVVSSGHTHRVRRRMYGPIVTTEIASSRDWPGVWAGYTVYEGGVVQIVRRISHPDAITWHEYSRRALAGLWGPWAVGPIDQRSFAHHWPVG